MVTWPVNLPSFTKARKFPRALRYKLSYTQGQVHGLECCLRSSLKGHWAFILPEHVWSKWPEWWLQNSHLEVQVGLLSTKVVWVQLFVWDPLRALLQSGRPGSSQENLRCPPAGSAFLPLFADLDDAVSNRELESGGSSSIGCEEVLSVCTFTFFISPAPAAMPSLESQPPAEELSSF